MFYIPSSPKKYKKYWLEIRRRAPKVPVLTCPAIDGILTSLEKSINGKSLTLAKYKTFERKMEKLRMANEQLRESGETNMFGAGVYLQKHFKLPKHEAIMYLTDWMKQYKEGEKSDEKTNS